MTLENFNLQITTPEDDNNTDPEFIRLRSELMALKQPLLDAIANKDLPNAEELHKQALEAKAKLEAYKESLKNKEKGKFTYEQYISDIHPFMIETYKGWSYTEDQLKIVEQVTAKPDNIHIDQEIPFDEMVEINKDSTRRETNKSKTGELYIISESIDFKSAKLFIPEIPEDIKAQGVGGIMKYIHETYKDTHILPDLRYYQYLAQLGDQYKDETDPIKNEELHKLIPEQLRDGNWYHFPGSALVDEFGDWISPSLDWRSGGFYRSARGVGSGWSSTDRVVLLER